MSKDIKKALEHCVEWKCDNCPNGDDLGSGEIVCRGRLLPQVLEYVADLEAKLAESEKQCRDCKHLNKKIELNIKNKLLIENAQLKQQLEEKDKEIESYKHTVYMNMLNQEMLELKVATQEKAKTDFAIEKLEKLKEFFLEEHRDEEMDTDYIITKDAGQIADYLLDQIKGLKEKK